MNANLIDGLTITVYGLGLVFSSLLLLWGLMSLLVRLTSKRKTSSGTDDERLLKQKAAAAAVAYALSSERHTDADQIHIFPLPPTTNISPWQAVMRSNILDKRGQVR